MKRREFLALAAAAGPARAAADGWVLVHEHVMVDFVGADAIRPGRYDAEEVFRAARPRLAALRALGCARLQECTPNYLGRDARLMARLADATGVEIWSNTGLYGAADHKYLPAFVRTESAEQLARRWVAEAKEAWRPRFIKIGVNRGPLDELDRKLVHAAAIASRETGLTIASHTGDGAAALEQLELITAARVPTELFVWVHAQNERNTAIHERVARAGAWVEFDGVAEKSVNTHLDFLRNMEVKGLLGRTLLSQDSGWYHVGEAGGGTYRGYTFLWTDFVPWLEEGVARVLLWDNPRAAFGTT